MNMKFNLRICLVFQCSKREWLKCAAKMDIHHFKDWAHWECKFELAERMDCTVYRENAAYKALGCRQFWWFEILNEAQSFSFFFDLLTFSSKELKATIHFSSLCHPYVCFVNYHFFMNIFFPVLGFMGICQKLRIWKICYLTYFLKQFKRRVFRRSGYLISIAEHLNQ